MRNTLFGYAIGYTLFGFRCNERFWLMLVDCWPYVRWRVIKPFGGLFRREVVASKFTFKRVRAIAETGEPV
jgi:hypothetical protein